MTLTKHFNTKKLLLTFIAASLLTLLTSCSSASKNQPQVPSATQGMVSPTPSQNTSPTATYSEQQDQDLTKKLTSEKIVQSGKVYSTGDKAIASITVKKGTDEKTYRDLATKYANTLKQKYSNKKINAYVILENKIVANISL
jgi:hypothetical protein